MQTPEITDKNIEEENKRNKIKQAESRQIEF
jgi:hypothetical protein